MITATQSRLEIARHRIDPVKLRFFCCRAPTAADDSIMGAPGLSDCIETIQAVGGHLSADSLMLLSLGRYLRLKKAFDHAELDLLRMVF